MAKASDVIPIERARVTRPNAAPVESIASKLLAAGNFWRRSGNAFYRRQFGLSITDVHVLTVLAARAPMSLNAMADECGIDKTQMSRAVKALVQRKLVLHSKSETNPGELSLSLDKAGIRMCRKLKPAAEARLVSLLASCSEADIRSLDTLFDTLIANARAVAETETAPPSRLRKRG